ncbi:MAG: ComEC/Rec2 family competence protein, partial [Desulfocucumaceae bacterium]
MSLPWWMTLPLALASLGIAAVFFFVLHRDVFPVMMVVFLLLGCSAAAQDQGYPEEMKGFLGKTATLEGYICREPDFRGDKTVYTLEVKRVLAGPGQFNAGGRVLVYVPESKASLTYGDALRVQGRPYIPESPGNPGQFDYGSYLGDRGIWGILSVKETTDIEKTASGEGNPIVGAALRTKQRLIEVNLSTLEPGHASIVNGIIFGTRGGIDSRTAEVFNESGVVHILSVSGLHVGLVAGAVAGLLGMAGLQRISFPVLSMVLILYSFITGMGPAVVRASLMIWVQILGHRLGRDRDWPTTLAVAALIILVFSPGALYNPGFQLSFAATWGILQIGPAIDRRLKTAGLGWVWVRGIFSVSLGAQMGTLPLVAYYFNIFSLISIPAN